MNTLILNKSAICYHPELGGLVSGLIIDGQEILYCDDTSLTSCSIRGGIPTMLPNPGVGDGVMPRHGIARTAQFTSSVRVPPVKGDVGKTGGLLTLTLDRNQSTILSEQYELFPHDFIYDLSYELIDHGCIITQQVTNPVSPLSGGEGSGVRMGFGLHPYFPTPTSITQVQYGVESGLLIDHHNDDTQVLKNPGIIVLTYPNYRLCIEYSDVYPRVWIWTPTGHDAICIEPVTHDVGDYFTNPIMIAPGTQLTAIMKFTIETLT